MSDLMFQCPYEGAEAVLRSVLTNKGERQAVICEEHGILCWAGRGEVGGMNAAGATASFNSTAAALADLAPGEIARAGSGPFMGVWAVRPPGDQSHPVIVPTVYASLPKGYDPAAPALTVTTPFTGRWKGRLEGGVWYAAVDLI